MDICGRLYAGSMKKQADRIRIKKGIVLVRRGETWHREVRSRGQRFRTTLATGDLSEAMRRAEELPTTPTVVPGMLTVGKALERYETWYREHNRKSSAARTIPILEAFGEFIGTDDRLDSITRQRVIDYRNLRADKVSPHTANAEYARLRAFTNWLHAESLIDAPICVGIRRLPIPTQARHAPTQDDVVALLKHFAGHPWLHDWIRLLAETGMRPQEALAIRGVDYKDGMLKIRAWGDWKIKTGQDRSIEVNAIAREILDRRKREMDDDALPLFHSKKNTRRGPREAYHALKNWLKKNIKEKELRDD